MAMHGIAHIVLAGCVFLLTLGVSAEEVPRFNRDIRPILSDKCFPCHGPDANTRKAGLRLDTFEGAVADGAVTPGQPDASELLARVMAHDPDDRMPPGAAELALSAEEVDTLRRWIVSGAAYEPHWAFVPPGPVIEPPTVQDGTGWVSNELDKFVLARLEAEGVQPAAMADKETLLRRVTLDLTGLPPTPAEREQFLADTTPEAYTKVVDRLLASTAYGERMALDWLDVARYADTFGYQSDVEMDVWPWRDWVIKAFNENLPYDEFVTWQLAGDLLENPTRVQRLATTFNRLHRQTNEGGSINEEFRVAYVADRAETFSTAFLGLTMACARCHDHKFDPLSQRDYFSLFAYFDDIDESGIYSHFTRTAPTPTMLLYEDRDEERHAMLKNRIARSEESLAAEKATAVQRFEAWLASPERRPATLPTVVSLPLDSVENASTPDVANEGGSAKLTLEPAVVEGVAGQALAFSGDNGLELPGGAAFERSDAFTISFWIKVEAHQPKAVVVHRSRAETDAASRGYEVFLDEGRPVFSLIHFWPGNAIRIMADAAIATNAWLHVAARYDGSSRAEGLTLYVNGSPIPTTVVRDNLYKTIQYEGDDKMPFTLAQRFRDSGLKDGALDEVQVFSTALSPLEIRALAAKQGVVEAIEAAVAAQDNEALRDYFVTRVDAEVLETQSKLADARRREAAFVETVRNIMVMEELPEPRTAHLLDRGEYDRPKEAVPPATPASMLPFPEDAPQNRLGLARWLTHPDHPLTARVAVNRYWQLFFGRGIVETQEDFGSQGKPPSHPELLDYLARHFIASGWDVKALCKLIVTSATYRQDSGGSPALQQRDPDNRLLARGPRFRLNAESIRDQALAASGLISPRIGGPSAKPYQPPGLWEDVSYGGYVADTGEGLYRRSLYTFIKRTSPPPAMLTLDAGSREVCLVRRESTATPLQALVMLNDPQFVEAARVLAERTLAGMPEASAESRLAAIFLHLTARAPGAEELAILQRAHDEQRDWFAQHRDDALKYVTMGSAPRDESLDAVYVAAASAVTQAIMGLDEFQVRR